MGIAKNDQHILAEETFVRDFLAFVGDQGKRSAIGRPTDLQVISEALDMLGKDAGKIQPLFITLDPERDTEKVMAEYVQHFHPKLIGLTGTKSQTKAAADVYRIQKRIYYPLDGDKKDYLLDHSAAIILIGPDGGGLSMFPHGIAPEDIVKDIRSYLK